MVRSGRNGDLDVLLDRHADEAAALGPGSVVVADAIEAEQLVSTNQVWLDRSPIRQ